MLLPELSAIYLIVLMMIVVGWTAHIQNDPTSMPGGGYAAVWFVASIWPLILIATLLYLPSAIKDEFW